MAEPLYLSELKKKLGELGEIEDSFAQLKVKREDCRDQIRKWLDINNLTEYETLDALKKQLWRLSITTSSRNSTDLDILRTVVSPEDYDKIVSKSEFEMFKCQPVKSRKKPDGFSSKAPQAPKGNV